MTEDEFENLEVGTIIRGKVLKSDYEIMRIDRDEAQGYRKYHIRGLDKNNHGVASMPRNWTVVSRPEKKLSKISDLYDLYKFNRRA